MAEIRQTSEWVDSVRDQKEESQRGTLLTSSSLAQQERDVLHYDLCRGSVSHAYVSTQIKTCFDRLG